MVYDKGLAHKYVFWNSVECFLITQYNSDTHNVRTLIPMNTRTQTLPLWASSKTEPANPQDWWSHHKCLAVDGNVAYHARHLIFACSSLPLHLCHFSGVHTWMLEGLYTFWVLVFHMIFLLMKINPLVTLAIQATFSRSYSWRARVCGAYGGSRSRFSMLNYISTSAPLE